MANNVLWLSADNGVTVVGTAVTNWNDRSGNGNNAFSPSVAARPTLIASAINGRPMLGFNGLNSEMRVPDAASLDMTQWDIFFVNFENAPKTNNVWLAKGTNTQPNYALWSRNTDALQMPIYDIFGLLSSPVTGPGITGPFYSLLEYNNTVFLGLFPSRTIYKGGATVYNDVNLLQLPVSNNNPLYIGNVQGTAGWNLDGSLAEMIIYRTSINTTQRVIINNYLAAKYGLPLAVNDLYVQDDPANGHHDHDMAGIGRLSSSSLHTDSRGSGIVRIYGASNLGNNEFLLWGHNGAPMTTFGSTDYPPPLQGRWFREWRVSEVSTSAASVDVGAVTMDFDLSGFFPVIAGNVWLLVDTDNDGIFADETPIGPSIAAGGGIYRFSGVTALANHRRFTIGTIDLLNTPLPIELLEFAATPEQPAGVQLTWATAVETDNDHFAIERSADLLTWTVVAEMPGQLSSQQRIDYSAWDRAPIAGLSYYRLRQVDVNGASEVTDARPVMWSAPTPLVVLPNPNDGHFAVSMPEDCPCVLSLWDASGRHVWSGAVEDQASIEVDLDQLRPGVYQLMLEQLNTVRSTRVVIE